MIGALILGLVAGALARLVIPNDALKHLEGWRSWLATIVLGLVGALVGWLIFTRLFGIGDTDVFDLGGVIRAIIGSILVLVAVGWFLRRTGRRLVPVDCRAPGGSMAIESRPETGSTSSWCEIQNSLAMLEVCRD
jgi:uncharacterized membrane protein YeaQ/YmgE (transglycosylase-associated protein family)